jgi:hypothetical protein
MVNTELSERRFNVAYLVLVGCTLIISSVLYMFLLFPEGGGEELIIFVSVFVQLSIYLLRLWFRAMSIVRDIIGKAIIPKFTARVNRGINTRFLEWVFKEKVRPKDFMRYIDLEIDAAVLLFAGWTLGAVLILTFMITQDVFNELVGSAVIILILGLSIPMYVYTAQWLNS